MRAISVGDDAHAIDGLAGKARAGGYAWNGTRRIGLRLELHAGQAERVQLADDACRVDPWRPDQRERRRRAASLVHLQLADHAHAGIDDGGVEGRDVGAGCDPGPLGLRPAHGALPALHLDDPQIEVVETGQQLLALDQASQLADRHAVHDRDGVLADEGGELRLEHEARHILAAERIGPVEHDEGNARRGRGLHGEAHGRDVGVEAHADVLDVEHQHVDVAQHGGRRLLGCAVQAEHGHADRRHRPPSPTRLPASTPPRKPCSGARMAVSFTPSALLSRSARCASPTRPVWLVMSPTRLPASSAKPDAASTSAPLATAPGRGRLAA